MQEKEISISDLRQSSSVQKEVSIADLKPVREEESPKEQFLDNAMDQMDTLVARVAGDAKQLEMERKEYERYGDDELVDSVIKGNTIDVSGGPAPVIRNSSTTSVTPSSIKDDEETDINSDITSTGSIFDIDIDDLETSNKEASEEDKKKMNAFQTSIKEKIKPINDVIDISSFTISSKPVSVINALSSDDTNSEGAIDWILPATGVSVTLDSFRAFDIERLNPKSSSRNRFNTYKDIYRLIYNHIKNPNKPGFEAWLKIVKFDDLDHLYFAVFKAAFDKVNAIPYNCPKCKEIFLKDIDIDSMIKYKNEESKAFVNKLLQSDTSMSLDTYEVENVQISDTFVIGFRVPSIYNIIFENAILEPEFTEKYQDQLETLSFIDNIYYIDRVEKALKPIALNVDPKNAVKTIKDRIKKYSDVLKSLSSDQLFNLNAYKQSIRDKNDVISYRAPEAHCTKCGHLIPEQVQTAESLLFTRHQLMGIANMSID